MDTLADTIAEALREKVNAKTLEIIDLFIAEWIVETQQSSPNWLRMIAGANPDAFEQPNLYDALIEEVKAQMEQDDGQLCSPPNQ